jgi:WD40 repeat protein
MFGSDGRAWLLRKEANGKAHTLICLADPLDERSGQELRLNEEPASVALAQNGRTVAVASSDGVRVYEFVPGAKGFKEAAILPTDKPEDYWRLSLSADGSLAVGAIHDDQLRLWSVKEGRILWTTRCLEIISDPDRSVNWITQVAFSADGRTIFSGDGDGWIRQWDVATGKEQVGPDSSFFVASAARTYDGAMVAVGSADGRIAIIDSGTGRRIRQWSAGSEMIINVGFAKCGLMSSDIDGGIKLWDSATGKLRRQITSSAKAKDSEEQRPVSLSVSGNGSRFSVNERAKHRIGIYDGSTGGESDCLPESSPGELVFSEDGQRAMFVADNGLLKVYDVSRRPIVRRSYQLDNDDIDECFAFMAISRDGRFVTSNFNLPQMRIWDDAVGRLRREWTLVSLPARFAFSPDGLCLAVGYQNGAVALIDLESGTELLRRVGHQDHIFQLHFARSIRTLLSVSGDRTALMWSLRPDLPNPFPKPDTLWADLASPDAAKAYRAFWGFIEQPESASFLSERLRTAQKEFDPAKVRKWLSELDDRSFPVRDAASAALARLGPAIEPALRQELEAATTAEKRQRLNKLLDAFGRDRPPDQLRLLRAVSALAEIGTPAAKKALQELAKADELAPLTADAKAALQRITD